MYSQNSEEQIIKDYFRGEQGTLLDIGANDGKTLSNSLALIEAGWSAILIEPCKIPYEKLCTLHEGNEKIYCLNIAIGTTDGQTEIYSSGDHLGKGDSDLLSTLIESETLRWNGMLFTKETVYSRTFESFLKFSPLKTFDFITIDAEGLDYDILIQMNLTELGCRMICVEHNGKDIQKFHDYILQFGFKEVMINAENIIMAL